MPLLSWTDHMVILDVTKVAAIMVFVLGARAGAIPLSYMLLNIMFLCQNSLFCI